MAMRYLVATIPSGSNYQLYDEDERTFSLSSYDPPVYGNCKVKSIYVNFSRMRHGSKDYYVEIDVDGVPIGETERKEGLLDTSTTVSHTMWFDPEMDEWQNALTETGSITVRCIINAGSGYLALRGGCEITIGVEYEEESYNWISAPSIKSVNQFDGKFSLSWNPASWSGPGSIWYYVNSNPSGPGDWLANTSSTSASNITIPAYGAVTLSVSATEYDTYTSISGSKSVTFYKPSLNAPTNFKINSSTSYTGATAPLTWTQGALNYTSGTRTYEIYKGNELITTTVANATSFTIPETTTRKWGTSAVTLKIRGKGTGLGDKTSGSTIYSGYTGTVSYTYRATVTTQPSGLKINGATSYTGTTAPLTWSPAAFSGQQTPLYSIRVNGTEIKTTTETRYTIPENVTKTYTSAKTITIVAIGGGATSNATNGVTYTYSPEITAPSNLKINGGTSFTGQSALLTWTEGSLSNEAAVIYSLRKNGVQFDTANDTSYTIPESIASKWGTSAVTITVVATGSGKTSSPSNGITFTYKPPFKTIKYHNGTAWVECIAYYHDGTRWVKCDLYYHDGTKWNLSDH